jgi:methionyl-tRNA synthetase
MPSAADRILDVMNVAPNARVFGAIGKSGALQAGAALNMPTPLFPKFVDPDAAQPATSKTGTK